MSDYCICKDCGCKHLVWEKSCPYCRRTAELEAKIERMSARGIEQLLFDNAELEAENKALLNALEKMTADRDEWQEASELWREDSNKYMKALVEGNLNG